MRSLIALAALLSFPVVGTATGPAAPPPGSPPVPGEALFLISGRGWGHGVGMSQFGAFGMASDGASYDRILRYYYSGITLGRVATRDVRVLLAEGRRGVTISSTAPFTAIDAAGTTYKLRAGALVLGSNLELPTPAGRMPASSPLHIRPGKGSTLALDGRPYRGRIEVSAQGAFLRVVNVVGLESYLPGVVAGEMPDRWPLEALKAQAVAARSYALANILKGKPFDLYADQRSQVYLGAAGEKLRTTEAVRSTAGQVVLYSGKIASTMYFSSSGGRTASATDVFGVSIPYLVSRPDPWDAASPYHRWGPVLVGARTLQSKLGISSRVVDLTGVATPSGWLRSVTLQTTSGSTVVPAAVLRASLGLRSTSISIGALRLDRPSTGTVVFGSSLLLTGLMRGVGSASLSSSLDGALWTPVRKLAPAGDGSLSLAVRPTQTMRYRIEAKGGASPALLVRVAPRVRLAQPTDPRVLSGSVRPRLTGASVAVERQSATGWTSVADAVVDQSGAFRAKLTVAPGTYRARVPPTNGFAQGLAPVLTVSG